MKKTIMGSVLAAVLCASPITPTAAMADDRDYHWNGDRDSDWDPSGHYRDPDRDYRDRDMVANDRVYRGSDGRYYCKRGDGTTGLVVGGIAGGVLGNVIAGGTLGTLLGAGGGALLGRHIDRSDDKVKCR
jgi:hypothetical protein